MSQYAFTTPVLNWCLKARPDIIYTGTVGSCGFASTRSPVLTWDLDDDANLYSKLAQRSYGHDWNGAVFLGELRESLGMIGSTAAVLASSYRHVRRGNLAAAWTSLKTFNAKASNRDIGGLPKHLVRVRSREAASHWLQMRYGWRPLIGDVYTAGQAMASLVEFPPPVKVRARRVKKESLSNRATGLLSSVTTKELHRNVTLYWDRPPDVIASLGLKDPELVAWELMPYSFVVDWFIPIGKYLEARAFAQSFSGTAVVTNLTVERTRVSDDMPDTAPYSLLNGESLRIHSARSISMTRTVSSTLPSVTIPQPRPVLSALTKDTARALDAISLLRAAFRR
jgi:hypothetical protein